MGVINKVRGVIDKALDALIAWIVTMAKSLFAKVFGKKEKEKKPSELTPEQRVDAAVDAGEKLLDDPNATLESIKSKLPGIQGTYKLKVLSLIVDAEGDEEFEAHVHGENSPGNDGKKKKVPKSAKTTPIGPIDIPRESMRWTKATKIALAKKFAAAAAAAGRTAAGVQVSTGKILTKKKYGRRHIISFSDMATHYKAAFPAAMKVAEACAILAKFKASADVKFTKKSVASKVKSLCRAAFNWPKNVAIGLQAANSSLGATVDTDMLERHGKTVQKALDDHVKEFLLEWAIPGVPFGVSEKQGEVEWEVTET